MTSTQARIDRLQGLSARAEQEAPGGLIAAAVYGPDLASARTEMRMLIETYTQKRCTEGPTPAAQPAPPGEPPAPITAPAHLH